MAETTLDLSPDGTTHDVLNNAAYLKDLELGKEDAELNEDELDESAPNWAFASFISEKDELLGLFQNLVIPRDSLRITTIIVKYQEQPQLLDPHLAFMTSKLLGLLRTYLAHKYSIQAGPSTPPCSVSDEDAWHLFHLVYTLTKVRGYKTVSKQFPHAVDDLEPTFLHLEYFKTSPVVRPVQPAQVDNTQPVHALLLQAQQFNKDETEWKAPYVLLLWLSVIGLIPFDLNALDNSSSSSTGESLKSRMLNTAKHFLSESSITRNAAAELLSNLLTRPDMSTELESFLQWSMSTITRLSASKSSEILNSNNQYLIAGLYLTLALIFQKTERERCKAFILPILNAFFPKRAAEVSKDASNNQNVDDEGESSYELPSNIMINKKLSVKLVQRMALVLLRPRVARWRYQRRTVSLLSNLKKPSSAHGMVLNDTQEEEDDEEDYEIPEETEDFVHLLLSALRDKDTIVRWSAAKGIGRLTNRLPQALADEVVGSLFALFDSRETDCAWHGACLAVAELSRRGLLLPQRLPELLPKLNFALQFEIRRGNHTTGAHVRDAACYVAWALARAYDPAVLRSHLVITLASSLLLTALYDKEVNCRRAAAAAYQEHVGRQVTFPHGIEVISIVNFFTLSNRSESFLTLAPQVASFEEYRKPFIDHLASVKCQHVDHALRELGAKSLAKISKLDPVYISSSIIPKLVSLPTNPDFSVRQGSVQALAEIVSAFADIVEEKMALDSSQDRSELISQLLPPAIQEKIWDIPYAIERARLYRGRGAEYLRIAVLKLIESISKIGLSLKASIKSPLPQTPGTASTSTPTVKGPAIAQRLAGVKVTAVSTKDALTAFIETIEENLRHPNEDVIAAAVHATGCVASRYIDQAVNKTFAQNLVKTWMITVKQDPNAASRRGHSLALGALPSSSIGPLLQDIIECLIDATKILGTKHELDDAEVRRNAVIALADLAQRLHFSSNASDTDYVFHQNQLVLIIDCLFITLNDYSTDNRGDIGSLVREASISSLETILLKIAQNPPIIDGETEFPNLRAYIEKFACHLVKQSLEKIDRTRDRAGTTFQRFLSLSLASKNDQEDSANHLQLQNVIPHGQEIWESVVAATHHKDANSILTNGLNWASSKVVFPILVQLFKYDKYRYWVTFGIVRSVGGANNSKELVEDASNALLSYMRALEQDPDRINSVAVSLLEVMKNNIGNESLIVSLWATLELLFSAEVLYSLKLPKYTFASELLNLARAELRLPSTINKLSASISIFSNLLGYSEPEAAPLRVASLKMMVFFLSYKYPVVRKSAAEALYLQLESSSHIVVPDIEHGESEVQANDRLEKVKELLTTVSWVWDNGFQAAKESISQLLGVSKP